MSVYDGRWVASELIADRAERWPDRVAISMPEGDLTYAALADRAARVAGGLHGLGLRPGDTVATMLEAGRRRMCGVARRLVGRASSRRRSTPSCAVASSSTSSDDCGARALVVDGAAPRSARRARPAASSSTSSSSARRTPRHRPRPAGHRVRRAARARSARARSPGRDRSRLHPLHVGHDRARRRASCTRTGASAGSASRTSRGCRSRPTTSATRCSRSSTRWGAARW